MATLVPTIRLCGTAHERGLAHGRQLQERISKTWKWYEAFFSSLMADSPDALDTIHGFADHFANVIHEFNPEYSTEIEAIAQGSGMEAWKIYAINARTEIMYNLRRTYAVDNQGNGMTAKQERTDTVAAPAGAPASCVESIHVRDDSAVHNNSNTKLDDDDALSECTSVYCSEFPVLAQNWDWGCDLEKVGT